MGSRSLTELLIGEPLAGSGTRFELPLDDRLVGPESEHGGSTRSVKPDPPATRRVLYGVYQIGDE